MTAETQARLALAQAEAMRDGCLGVRVGRLHRLVAREFDLRLSPLGLSVSQMEVMSALILADGPVRPSDLADWLLVERSTMSRNLSLMEEKGLVEAAERSPSGRSMSVRITAEGTGRLAEARKAWSAAQAVLTDALGADAVASLDAMLGRPPQKV